MSVDDQGMFMRGLFAGAALAALLMSASAGDAAAAKHGHSAHPVTHKVPAMANSADAKFRKIYTDEWAWREEQLADNEDAQKPVVDHLPKVDAATQEMRLKH